MYVYRNRMYTKILQRHLHHKLVSSSIVTTMSPDHGRCVIVIIIVIVLSLLLPIYPCGHPHPHFVFSRSTSSWTQGTTDKIILAVGRHAKTYRTTERWSYNSCRLSSWKPFWLEVRAPRAVPARGAAIRSGVQWGRNLGLGYSLWLVARG